MSSSCKIFPAQRILAERYSDTTSCSLCHIARLLLLHNLVYTKRQQNGKLLCANSTAAVVRTENFMPKWTIQANQGENIFIKVKTFWTVSSLLLGCLAFQKFKSCPVRDITLGKSDWRSGHQSRLPTLLQMLWAEFQSIST